MTARARRCSYRDEEDGSRCQRNGRGNPPLCRQHAILLIAEQDDEMPEWFNLGVGLVDRALSQSQNEVVRSLRDRLGDLLSGAAGSAVASEAARAPREARRAAPPPPPPAAAPPPDPRVVLGFEPGAALTKEQVKERQRDLAKLFHPDRGGSTQAMQAVNDAARRLLAEM